MNDDNNDVTALLITGCWWLRRAARCTCRSTRSKTDVYPLPFTGPTRRSKSSATKYDVARCSVTDLFWILPITEFYLRHS